MLKVSHKGKPATPRGHILTDLVLCENKPSGTEELLFQAVDGTLDELQSLIDPNSSLLALCSVRGASTDFNPTCRTFVLFVRIE